MIYFSALMSLLILLYAVGWIINLTLDFMLKADTDGTHIQLVEVVNVDVHHKWK